MARSCKFRWKDRRSISRWIVIPWGKRYIRRWHRGNKRRIDVGCLGQQCFHWSGVHGWGMRLGIRRWWLGAIFQWWHNRLIESTNIGCILRWIRETMASRLDSKLIRLSIGGSSVGCIGYSSGIRSFHQLFLCTRSLGMGLLVVWYQWSHRPWESRQLKNKKMKFDWIICSSFEVSNF